MKQLLRSRYGWLLPVAALAIVAGLLLPLASQAHVTAEEPWHPAPAAYRRALFYANLGPQIDWELIAGEFETPIAEPGYDNQTVYDMLAQVDAANGTNHVAAIRQAIANQNRQALYAASTRAISQMTRHFIAQAAAKLDQPGAGLQDILDAQRIYRAFRQDFMEQADPQAVQRLGQAWLDIASSVGNAGILEVASMPADPEKFAAARQIIEDYLVANYEVDEFTARSRLAPLPETAGQVEIAPWLPPGSNLNDQDPLPLLRLNFEARGFEESDIPLVAYGDMLFDSPEIFGDPARSLGLTCSTCHNRSDINQTFFIPGVSHQAGAADVDGAFFNPFFNDQRSDSLDIPTLRGLRFTAPYGRDGRFESLREFTRNVIVNEFAGEEPTEFMLDALVAYMLEFDFQPNSNLNPDGTLTAQASESARRGEEIFNTTYNGMMGGMACASCHIPGSHFTDNNQWDIGSAGEYSDPYAYENYFDTPTLLNVNYTAPYFHDGSLDTLEDVVNWKNEQFKMNLNEQQLADLTEYVKTVGAADTPYEVFDEENTPFRLAWAELTTFATTLDTMLIRRQDAYHAILLIDTVAPDFRADASGLQDLSQAPLVYEVADKLDEIKAAIEADDWDRAGELYDEYEALVKEYTPLLK